MVAFAKMAGGKRAPILAIRVGRGFALDDGNSFLDFLNAFAAPGVERDLVRPCVIKGVFLGYFQTVPAARGFLELRVHVAEVIVFAVAGHTGAIGTLLGVPLPIETHLLQAAVTEPIKPLLHTVLVYSYDHADVYVSQSDRGGLVMGGALDGFPSYTREGQWYRLEDVAQGIVALLPQVAGLRILRHWAGTNDMTMDGSPILDRVAFGNVFLNGGWCYGGFKAIPASGAAFARFVATGTPPDLIRHFNLGRFATGQLLDERGMGPFPVRH